ncbi:hypothetical protein JR316_0010545 [Psilocybe cubensis]|uniref:Alpha-L-rhamnosidase six-hairpin glycosidase domain-containing protein n=2 Tax=Psilocybe cubensis TaxID=181762 RepID=A0A8H7XM69_PSICU|nr:hypothetical protein JR316_0010545 [Psilocybe cubensis]KAH9476632.1 hypothetical protein JR316_0010545 [Psilocybe cubensis]
MALEEPPLRGQVVMRLGSFLLFVLLRLELSCASAPSGPWDAFNLAPESKTVYPAAIHSSHGSVKNSNLLVKNKGKASLSTNGSWIALDFGIEVGGLISLNLNSNPSPSSFSLSFTESPTFIRSSASDDSSFPSANTTYDGVLQVSVPAHAGYWVQPASSLRGGFRYLTVVSNSENAITLSNVSCAISFVPHLENMRDYAGYFYAKDPQSKDEDLLTKIWYAGAYTVQTNTVALNSGRHVPFSPAGSWANDATLGVAGPIIVDGAKRDRAVWPGDMGIAVPTQFVSTNDLIPTRNALSTMFAAINPKTGALPESGPPLSQQGSDTYHAWTLIGTYNYVLFSGDVEWLQGVWANYTKAVAFLEGKVDGTGLMDVTGLRDWARQGGGGYNAEGNAILYKVLTTASSLASTMSLPSLSSTYLQNATALKSAFNNAFWLPSKGMYRDNQTTTLCPQDANSFAILFNLTEREEQKRMVSDGLVGNWNGIGPVAPELPDTISPFISGFEIQAHFEAGNDARAMELIRRTWGYMLTTDLSVQSTLLEGFTANGSLAYRYNHGYNDDPAYTSHSHGWSSGPTPALTFYVLGMTLTELQGRTWALAPHFGGGLCAAEGGFQTGLGWFGVKWSAVFGEQGELESLMMSIETPEGTNGVVMLPKGINGRIAVDGPRVENLNLQDSRAVTLRLIGGKHEIQVHPV